MICKCNSCNRPAREDGYCYGHSPARQRAARKKDPERFKKYTLQRDYGIAYEQYQQLVEQQEGKCAICRHAPEAGERKLAVDHSHATGVVRGLLCGNCNLGIGSFFDSPELLKRAAGYLEQPAPTVVALVADVLLEELTKK